jgi:hypothetical protein
VSGLDDGGDARGFVRVENITGRNDLIVEIELPDSLGHVEIEDASLSLEFDSDGHACARWQRTNPQPQPDFSDCESIDPNQPSVITRTYNVHSPGNPQGGPQWTVTVEVYLGGRVVSTGEEPAGEYSATIPVMVHFAN